MENELVFSTTTYALVGNAFAVALSAHVVGFLYFLASRERIAPRYRMATTLSLLVMASSGLLFARLGISWAQAFSYDGTAFVPGDARFDNGLRYVNWFVTVPLLLVQVTYAFDLVDAKLRRLRVVLVTAGTAMIALGYVGQFFEPTPDEPSLTALLAWGTASTVPFLVLLAVLLPQLVAARAGHPGEGATTLRNMLFVLVFFWGLYPLGYLVPAVSVSDEAVVVKQALFTAADIGSKVLWGVLLVKVLRLRSAAEGFAPAQVAGR